MHGGNHALSLCLRPSLGGEAMLLHAGCDVHGSVLLGETTYVWLEEDGRAGGLENP